MGCCIIGSFIVLWCLIYEHFLCLEAFAIEHLLLETYIPDDTTDTAASQSNATTTPPKILKPLVVILLMVNITKKLAVRIIDAGTKDKKGATFDTTIEHLLEHLSVNIW